MFATAFIWIYFDFGYINILDFGYINILDFGYINILDFGLQSFALSDCKDKKY